MESKPRRAASAGPSRPRTLVSPSASREQALFDLYLNLCPGQGSRTIRTEEALLVGLAALQPHTRRAGAS